MRFDFIAGFMLITSVYGVIVSLILLLFPQKNTFNKRLLGVSLLSYALFCLYMAIMYSHLIFVWPHLFRVVAPVMYLVAPTSYLYVRMSVDLDIPTHVLSATINTEFHLSFRDLINKYHVEYIINSISGQKIANYTFEGIALEAGFNSRTTFYRAFIKVTGETPTTYFKKEL
jgi:Helix-turn-helix domain